MGSSHAKSFFSGAVENGVLTAICDLKPEKLQAVLALKPEEAPAYVLNHNDNVQIFLVKGEEFTAKQ